MTIKIKLRGNGKITIKFDAAIRASEEEQWFINLMRSFRDSDPETHPQISIRQDGRELPKMPPPTTIKPEVVQGTPVKGDANVENKK